MLKVTATHTIWRNVWTQHGIGKLIQMHHRHLRNNEKPSRVSVYKVLLNHEKIQFFEEYVYERAIFSVHFKTNHIKIFFLWLSPQKLISKFRKKMVEKIAIFSAQFKTNRINNSFLWLSPQKLSFKFREFMLTQSSVTPAASFNRICFRVAPTSFICCRHDELQSCMDKEWMTNWPEWTSKFCD